MRGVANAQKRRSIFDKHRIHSDILILQETHSTQEHESIWANEWGGKIIYSHGTSQARGIAILTSKEIFTNISNIETDSEGRLIVFDLEQDGQKLCVAAIYAPNTDSPQYFKNLDKILKNRCEHKIILGDFNLVLDVEMDRENTYCNNNNAKAEVEELMEHYGMKETWRMHNTDRKEYSWIKKGSWPTKASRIDFALISAGIDQKVQTIQYISSTMTDHRALYIVIDLKPFTRGTGYWKFNTSLLQKQDFITMMRQEIEATLASVIDKDPNSQWELLKKRVKNITIQFCKQNTSQDKLVISQLSEKVQEYESKLPLTKEEDELLQITKAELEDKTLERIKGVMFRSKAKWYEEGERNSKYFFALEKIKYNSKTCFKIIKDDQEIEDPGEILEIQKEFYQDLYSEDEEINFNITNSTGITVPEEIYRQQEEQITLTDIECAIKGIQNSKTPGEDGLPIEFYKVFWNQIKTVFYQMVLYSYNQKLLHETARHGILNLIPKANKDARYIKNLRPITLLNTDYKIVEKAIANKMIPALEHIIHKDQRGFMKDRRISVNIRKMLDIMHLAEKEDLEAVILSLDFVKCFDKCSFSILHGSLNFFDFGEHNKRMD